MKLREKLGYGVLYLCMAFMAYSFTGKIVEETLNITMFPYEQLDFIPIHGDIYKNISKADSTTVPNSDSLENAVLQAKQDGTKVVQ